MDKTHYPKLINSDPIGVDQFEGKSQETIANSIIELLNKRTCQMIGIDGGWGTGKSNLVKIIESKLKGKGFYFFTYDAWGHQEDIQRRAILEELTDDLTSEVSNFDTDQWKDKLKTLLAKNKETVTKTKPSLSLGIIFSFIAIIVTPLLQIITENLKNSYLKAAIVSLPLLFLIGLYIRFYKQTAKENEKFKKTFGFRKKAKVALEKLFEIYQKDQIENTTFESITEEEPSVAKFRDWMEEIDTDLEENKLVLIFDNMDRLPNLKVQELWSSIHAFFADKEYKNISVIVPFDRAHIKLAFKENGDIKCYGDDFINKTFKVVFRVSAPILSNWKKFFEDKWKEAFGETDDDLTRIIQIYDVLNEQITPREIIAFINEFVSIKMITRNIIPNKYIALFLMGKVEILKSPLNEIINPSYLKGLSFLYKNDEELPKYIAAVTYQIPPEDALQIIYTKQLNDALNNNDLQKAKLIAQSPVFEDVLVSVLSELNNIKNAVVTLNEIDIKSFRSETTIQEIWDIILRKALETEIKSSKIDEYQVVLLTNISHKKIFIKHLIDSFRSTEKFNASDYAQSIDEIDKVLKTCRSPLNILELLYDFETSVEDFIEFVKFKKVDYTKYLIYCDEDYLDEELSGLKVDDLKKVDYIAYIADEYELEKFKKALKDAIKNNTNNAINLITLYQILKETKPGKIEVLLPDNEIHNHFNILKPENPFYFDLLAMRLAKKKNFNGAYSSIFDAVLKKEDESLAENLAETVGNYINYDEFMLGLEAFGNYPLYVLVSQKLTKENYIGNRANILNLIKKFNAITKLGKIEPDVFITKLNQWSGKEIKAENLKDDVPFAFIDKAYEMDVTLANHVIYVTHEFLSNLSEEEWYDAFADIESFEIDCALLIGFKWNMSAVNSFKTVLKEMAGGDLEIDNKDKWEEVVNNIEKSGRKLTAAFNNVRDEICLNNNMDEKLFLFFGNWLFKYSSLNKKQEVLRTVFPPSILNNEECLSIILENKEKIPSIFDAAGEEEASDFENAIIELAGQQEDERLIDFAKYLGLKLPEIEEEE